MYQGSDFSVTVEDKGDRALIRALGQFDVATEFRWNAALAEAHAHPSRRVDVDLSEVTSIDSCGLRLLLAAWRRAHASEVETMTIVKMSPALHRLAELTGVIDTLIVAGSRQP